MGWTFPDNLISIDTRITKNNAWGDVDVSDDLPAGTKAIILQARNTYAAGRECAFRPNGNSDSRTTQLPLECQKYFYVKLDASGIFEALVRDSTVLVAIVGYTTDDYGFASSVDKSTGTTGAYEDVDVSANVPADATGVWLEANAATVDAAFRRNGASDDYYAAIAAGGMLWFMGLDGSYKFEQKIASTAVDLYVWGYTKSEAALLSSYHDLKPGSINSWQEVDCSSYVPSDAIAAIFLMRTNYNAVYDANLRKKGSTDNITTGIKIRNLAHIIGVVGLDANLKCECWTSNITHLQFLLIGYIVGEPPFGERIFPLPDGKTAWQSQVGKRVFPMPGTQE